MHKISTSPKLYASTTLGNLRWQIQPSMQYMYILMNHWIATKTTGSHCLKNCQTCGKLHHLYTTCSKCPPRACTKISDVDELKRHIKNKWTVWITLFIECEVGNVVPASTCLLLCWRQKFGAHDIRGRPNVGFSYGFWCRMWWIFDFRPIFGFGRMWICNFGLTFGFGHFVKYIR